MSTFTGPQGKGAMRRHREKKRAEAYDRNARSFASPMPCGHVHGEARKCEAAR